MCPSIYFDPGCLSLAGFSVWRSFQRSVFWSQQLVSHAVVKIDKVRISPSSDNEAFNWLWWTLYIIVIGPQFERHSLKWANNHYPFSLSPTWLSVSVRALCAGRLPMFYIAKWQYGDLAKHFTTSFFHHTKYMSSQHFHWALIWPYEHIVAMLDLMLLHWLTVGGSNVQTS